MQLNNNKFDSCQHFFIGKFLFSPHLASYVGLCSKTLPLMADNDSYRILISTFVVLRLPNYIDMDFKFYRYEHNVTSSNRCENINITVGVFPTNAPWPVDTYRLLLYRYKCILYCRCCWYSRFFMFLDHNLHLLCA